MAGHFGLIGYPLGHSCSKELHQALFELSGDFVSDYQMIELPLHQVETCWEKLSQLDGFNVTIPHKLQAYQKVDRHALTAKQCGSVNTVKREPDGTLTGYNTDLEGFLHAITPLPGSLQGKVLLLGCGGVGHMMATRTVLEGGSLTVAVRPSSLEHAEVMAESLRLLSSNATVRIVDIRQIPQESYDILLQATSCGMHPDVDEMPIDESVLNRVGCVFDVIYNPIETTLMKVAKKRGIPVVGGMPMLVWQAVAAHEIWEDAHYSQDSIDGLIEEFTQKMAVK